LYKFYLVDFKLFEQFQFFAISITLQEESKVWKEEKIKKFLKLVFKSVQVDLHRKGFKPPTDRPFLVLLKRK